MGYLSIFTGFIAGLDISTGIDTFSTEIQDYFKLRQERAFYDIGFFYSTDEAVNTGERYMINNGLKSVLSDLELESRVDTLNEDYFELITTNDGIPAVKMKETIDVDSLRTEKSLLLREPVTSFDSGIKTPADLVEPTLKTVRCSAMHSRLPKGALDGIRPVMDSTDFHPDSMNCCFYCASYPQSCKTGTACRINIYTFEEIRRLRRLTGSLFGFFNVNS